MWSYVVVVYLVARDDRRVGFLESSHDFLSVSDFSVEAFHLVVVSVALNGDVAYVFGSALFLHRVELFQVCLMVVVC